MIENATVLSPYSWSPAVELANRVWKKRVLPVGDVEYQGRTLHFDRAYLGKLVAAFQDNAYDQVSFQLADSRNSHTNDPERHRGTITGLQLEPDGLYALAQVTEAGERVLSENPYLGVSARIVENYQRSDGKFYPAAIQHVLGTLDPRIPALGQWQPLDMSNSGPVTIDLSGGTWVGEPGPSLQLAQDAASGAGAGYDDDELTSQELDELVEAMTETELEMESGYGLPDEFAAFNEAFDQNWAGQQAQAQARVKADAGDAALAAARMKTGHRERDEDKMARLISRVDADTSSAFGLAAPSRQAVELSTEITMTTGYGPSTDVLGFSIVDDFGRDASRYPQLQSQSSVSTDWMAIPDGPPRSTYEAALSNFNATHDTGPAPVTYGGDPDGPDSPGHPFPQRVRDFAHQFNTVHGLLGDTFFGPNRPRQDPYAALAADLGRPDLAGPQPSYQEYPDVSELARGLGLK